MKEISLPSGRCQRTQFWLLAIAGGLIAIQISLTWRLTKDSSQVTVVGLYWGAVISLLWEKRRNLNIESDILSSLLGLLLVAFVLVRSLLMTSYDSIYYLSNFMAALGLALLASGIKGLPQYGKELIIVFAFNLPTDLLVKFFDISTFTARLATFMLSQSGFEVVRQGVNVVLHKGAVEVNSGCAGMEGIVRLLQLAVLFLVMFPITLAKKISVLIVAVLVAFVVNAGRVALMAILVAYSNREAFDYWHVGYGSQIFILISSTIFGVFCYFVSRKNDPKNHEPMDVSG